MSEKIIIASIFAAQDLAELFINITNFMYMLLMNSIFRGVEFNPLFYSKSVFDLNEGNLRLSNASNRYSTLFPKQKLSYCTHSIDTTRKEIKRHDSSNNIITF